MDGCDTVNVVVAVVVVAKGGDNDLPNAVVVSCQKFFEKKLFFLKIHFSDIFSFKDKMRGRSNLRYGQVKVLLSELIF